MAEYTDLLRRLERDNRILKGLVVACLVLATGMAVRAQPPPMAESLQAQAFVLRNEAGNTRATLALISARADTVRPGRPSAPPSRDHRQRPGTRGDGGWQDSESSLPNP